MIDLQLTEEGSAFLSPVGPLRRTGIPPDFGYTFLKLHVPRR